LTQRPVCSRSQSSRAPPTRKRNFMTELLISEREEILSAPTAQDDDDRSPDEAAGDLVKLFKLLSDETRVRILLQLRHNGELNVRSLCDRLGQSQPAVSHHLGILREAGLIDRRRDGKHNFYRLLPSSVGSMVESFVEGMTGSELARDNDRYYLID